MIRRILVLNAHSGPPTAERDLEAAFLALPSRIRQIRRYALGRNVHPMRPDLWMCTHVWETEFDTIEDMACYEADPAYRSVLSDYWLRGDKGAIDRAALIAYDMSNAAHAGDLLQPGRVRRLHLTTFSSAASEAMRLAADEALLKMPAAVPQIKAWALGYNVARPMPGIPVYEHSWDTSFDSIADLQHYVTCDYHIDNTHDYVVRDNAAFVNGGAKWDRRGGAKRDHLAAVGLSP